MVVDTSVLLYDPHSLKSFTGNDVIIPLIVLEELDRFKEKATMTGSNARSVNRFLDELREVGSFSIGIQIQMMRYFPKILAILVHIFCH